MSSGQTIDYAKLQQEAMRGVVRAVLQRVFKSGLPGDHHFYISFHTHAPGAIVSKRLREKYPQEMTIVLQHRFWDLIVSDDRFEVKLTFDGIPERLVVPFSAIKVFIDPSVRYGLQFDEDESLAEQAAAETRHALTADAAYDQVGEAHLDNRRPAVTKKPRTVRKPRSDKETTGGRPASASADAAQGSAPRDKTASPAPRNDDKSEPAAAPADAGPKVISLDQFRKK